MGHTILFFDPVKRNELLRTMLEPERESRPHAIFISHEHWDHCHPDTISSLCSKSTKVHGPSPIENPLLHHMTFIVREIEELKEASTRISVVNPNDVLEFNELKIKCLASQEGVAYLLYSGERKLLFMGDSPATTGMIAENPDIVLFPIWAVKGEEAKLDDFFTLAKDTLCIPMHYHESSEALPNFYVDMEMIKDLLSDVDLRILKRGEPIKI
jgi:L-ascorbate metabolism protein UlaG (beta-lactamase superfamily)